MRWLQRDRLSAIGLDVGSRAVKAVQLAGGPGAWKLAAASLIPRAENATSSDGTVELAGDELGRIARVLSRQGFVGDRVVLAVPHDKLRSGIIDLPRRDSGAPIEQIARMEAAGIHHLDPDAFEFAWAELPPTGRQRELTRAMVAACPHADADPLLDQFAEQGLDVVRLDVAAAALARFADVADESAQRVLTVLDIGQAAATLTIIHAGVVVYDRRLPELGVADLVDRLIDQFDLEPGVARYLLEEVGISEQADETDAMPADMRSLIQEHLERLARELNTSLSYARHQYPDVELGSVRLVGGAAQMPGLPELLSLQLPTDAAVLCPAHRAAVPSALGNIASNPGVSLAAALAMQERGADL